MATASKRRWGGGLLPALDPHHPPARPDSKRFKGRARKRGPVNREETPQKRAAASDADKTFLLWWNPNLKRSMCDFTKMSHMPRIRPMAELLAPRTQAPRFWSCRMLDSTGKFTSRHTPCSLISGKSSIGTRRGIADVAVGLTS